MAYINYSVKSQSAQPGMCEEDIVERRVYGQFQSKETVSLNEFAKHMASHGSVYKRSDILAVLVQSVDCLRELLLDGKMVQFGELGTFGISLKCRGAAELPGAKLENGDPDPGAWTQNNITAVNVTFNPGSEFEDLKKDASFNLVPRLRDIKAALKAQTDNGLEGGKKPITPDTPSEGGTEQE